MHKRTETVTIRLDWDELERVRQICNIGCGDQADVLRAALAAYAPTESDRAAMQASISPLRGVWAGGGDITAMFMGRTEISVPIPAKRRRDLQGEWTYDTAPLWALGAIRRELDRLVTIDDDDHPAADVIVRVNDRFEYVVQTDADAALIREHFQPIRPVIVA